MCDLCACVRTQWTSACGMPRWRVACRCAVRPAAVLRGLPLCCVACRCVVWPAAVLLGLPLWRVACRCDVWLPLWRVACRCVVWHAAMACGLPLCCVAWPVSATAISCWSTFPHKNPAHGISSASTHTNSNPPKCQRTDISSPLQGIIITYSSYIVWFNGPKAPTS